MVENRKAKRFKEGVKFDGEKIRMDLVPPEAVEAIALVLTHGAKKYEDRNWELGMTWGRVFGALMRHLWKWWAGKEIDKDSGLPHLDHALCCLAMLLTYSKRKIGKDNRK